MQGSMLGVLKWNGIGSHIKLVGAYKRSILLSLYLPKGSLTILSERENSIQCLIIARKGLTSEGAMLMTVQVMDPH